jgi:hypothetical protein
MGLTHTLSRWTTDELVGEVVRRTASDGPALRLVETTIIRARLAQSDRRFGGGIQPELAPRSERTGVAGTMEMGLADDDAGAALLTSPDHGVGEATSGAHTHDHAHRHTRAHALLPWERTGPS